MFTRQHYIAIAKSISTIANLEVRGLIASQFVGIFSRDNFRFDEAKFLTACGIEQME